MNRFNYFAITEGAHPIIPLRHEIGTRRIREHLHRSIQHVSKSCIFKLCSQQQAVAVASLESEV